MTNVVTLTSERFINAKNEYICTLYTVLHNDGVVIATKDFATALQAYINRAIV